MTVAQAYKKLCKLVDIEHEKACKQIHGEDYWERLEVLCRRRDVLFWLDLRLFCLSPDLSESGLMGRELDDVDEFADGVGDGNASRDGIAETSE